jgi:hypothetical protein
MQEQITIGDQLAANYSDVTGWKLEVLLVLELEAKVVMVAVMVAERSQTLGEVEASAFAVAVENSQS